MNNHGWQRALDVQMDTLKWHKSEAGMRIMSGYMMNVYNKGAALRGVTYDAPTLVRMEQFAKEEAKSILPTLWRGDTCYITSEMMHLVMQAAHDMEGHEIRIDFKNLMTPIGFVLMEEGIFGNDADGLHCGFHAMAWNATEMGFNSETDEMERCLDIYYFSDANDEETNADFAGQLRSHGYDVPPLCILHTYRFYEGDLIKHYDEDELPGSAIVEELNKVFYSIQLLSHQTIGKPVTLRPDRATRKRFNRMHPDEPERMITLITLRRKTVKRDEEEPQKVEWSRRWIVRGFWRKQPDKHGWHWRYIHEYIKGPEDKPLIITERRVFDFRR